MSKFCPNCHKVFDDSKVFFCPECGLRLDDNVNMNPALNLGDANTISGGVNTSDNHSVSNVDSHNVITSCITNNTSTVNIINLHKAESEVLYDREIDIIKIVRDAFVNGILDSIHNQHLN